MNISFVYNHIKKFQRETSSTIAKGNLMVERILFQGHFFKRFQDYNVTFSFKVFAYNSKQKKYVRLLIYMVHPVMYAYVYQYIHIYVYFYFIKN